MSRVSPVVAPPEPRAFQRAFAVLVISLLVGCAALVGFAWVQGPKLVDAQTDPVALITSSDQPLRLFVDQPIDEVTADQITVTPATPITVTTAGEVIAVQFDNPLLYDTDYEVRVDDVRGVGLPQAGTIEYRFRTGSPTFAYLDRGEDTDQVIRTGLTTLDREVLYSAPGIQDFVISGQVLAVVTTGVDDTSELSLVSLADGAVEQVRLPSAGVIRDLHATSVGFVLGLTFIPSVPTTDALGGRELLLLDLEKGRTFTTVTGLDGTPMQVTDWRFVPGRTALVVLSLEQTIFLVDAADGSLPTPLGRVSELVSVSADGSTLAARDARGAVLIDLANGTATPLTPSLIEGGMPFVGQVVGLANGDLVEKAALETGPGQYVVVVAVDDGTVGRVLYATPDLKGSIENLSVSPNSQYAVIEVVPVYAGSESDGYPQNPRATTITTEFVDIATGEIVRTIEGFSVRW